MEPNVLEEYLTLAINYAVPLVEACAATVILLGVGRAVVQYVRNHLRLDMNCLPQLRSTLIQSLVMGLEFQLAADVLKTATSPSLNQVLLLAALIGLRIALGVVLEREMHDVCEPKHLS
jgi:uncharacterized membrane protein